MSFVGRLDHGLFFGWVALSVLVNLSLFCVGYGPLQVSIRNSKSGCPRIPYPLYQVHASTSLILHY